MKQDKAMELVAALRSGEYEQGAHSLKTNGGKYCCLGVACLVAGEHFDHNNLCLGEKVIMPPKVQKYFGFYAQAGERKDDQPLLFGEKKQDALTVANDYGQTFEDIASYIEENWMDL